MKIALIGYGKMGKAIESVAMAQGHEIILRIDASNPEGWQAPEMKQAEVAIEFTAPESAPHHLVKCFELGVPVVCGTTGWLNQWEDVVSRCRALGGSFLYASNFSVGVNLFFELNKQLARLMAPHDEYKLSLEEIHHTEKKDAPSGTAITLAEQLIANNSAKKNWVNQPTTHPDELEIISKRIDKVPGTHKIVYQSDIDSIEITHTAHNRIGFAIGAVMAAKFLKGKTGIYTMQDVLGLSR
jgi:4-hydroxy-tetrahydrodipicolinate reductase